MTGWIDRLPAWARHYLFAASAVILTFAVNFITTNYTSWSLPVAIEGLIGSLLPMLAAFATTWTQQYGAVGNTSHPAIQDDVTDVSVVDGSNS